MANDSRSGGRQLVLNRQREQQLKDQEREREQIRKENAVNISTLDQQYLSRSDTVDDVLVANTVGLVTLDQYKQKKGDQDDENGSQDGYITDEPVWTDDEEQDPFEQDVHLHQQPTHTVIEACR